MSKITFPIHVSLVVNSMTVQTVINSRGALKRLLFDTTVYNRMVPDGETGHVYVEADGGVAIPYAAIHNDGSKFHTTYEECAVGNIIELCYTPEEFFASKNKDYGVVSVWINGNHTGVNNRLKFSSKKGARTAITKLFSFDSHTGSSFDSSIGSNLREGWEKAGIIKYKMGDLEI